MTTYPNLVAPANASDISNPSSIIWSNYVDMNHDVIPYLQATGISAARQIQLQIVIDYVCQISQQVKGNPIAPTQFFGRFDGWSGWNGAYILLPYYPILGVQQVAEWWGGSGPNYLSEQTPENQTWGFNIDARTGMLTRVFPGLVQMPWFPSARGIEVTWTAGYNPVPSLFKLPALEIIAEWWRETQQAAAGPPGPGAPFGIDASSDTYPGLPTRCKMAFASTAQIGIG